MKEKDKDLVICPDCEEKGCLDCGNLSLTSSDSSVSILPSSLDGKCAFDFKVNFKDLSINDSETISLSGKGSIDEPLVASLKISDNPNNVLQVDTKGLLVLAGNFIETPNTKTDSQSVTITLSDIANRKIQADVKISAVAGNILILQSDGLYVPTPPPPTGGGGDAGSVVITDSPSIDLSGNGSSSDNPLKADVKISGADGNALTLDEFGLYVATPDIPPVLRFGVPTEDDTATAARTFDQATFPFSFMNGNLLVGSTTNGSQKLQVTGDTYVSSTLKVGTYTTGIGVTAKIHTDGEIRSGGGFTVRNPTASDNTQVGMYWDGVSITFLYGNNPVMYLTGQGGQSGIVQPAAYYNFSSGSGLATSVIDFNRVSIAPPAGTNSMGIMMININPKLDNASLGTGTGTIYGVNFEPQVTSNIAPIIAFRNTIGNNQFNVSSGNTLIGTSTDLGYKLQVTGAANITQDSYINGVRAGKGNNSLANNTAFGVNNLGSITTGDFNTAMGSRALVNHTTGVMNTGIGYGALNFSKQAGYNTAIGGAALNNIDQIGSPANGGDNVGIGYAAIFYTIFGQQNVGIGSQSLFAWNGDGNIAIGYKAMKAGSAYGAGAGNNNILIGTAMELASLFASNQLNIGNIIFGTGINTSTVGAGNIMIGSTTDTGQKFQVRGGQSYFGETIKVQSTGFTTNTSNGTIGWTANNQFSIIGGPATERIDLGYLGQNQIRLNATILNMSGTVWASNINPNDLGLANSGTALTMTYNGTINPVVGSQTITILRLTANATTTSGSVSGNTVNMFIISPTLNVPTGTNAIATFFGGVWYRPTITDVTNIGTHYAHGNTDGINAFNTNSGNTLIGSITDNGSTNKLQVTGGIQTTTALKAGTYSTGTGMTGKVNTDGEMRAGVGYNLRSPIFSDNTQYGMYTGASSQIEFRWGGAVQLQIANVGGGVASATVMQFNQVFNPASGTSAVTINYLDFSKVAYQPVGTTSITYNTIMVNPQINNTTFGGGIIRGVNVEFAVSSLGTSTLVAFRNTVGDNLFNVNAGSVGIGVTASINASAKLQVDSTTQGVLWPRMTNAQRTAIPSPAVGLTVYQTDGTEGLYINTSAGWKIHTIV